MSDDESLMDWAPVELPSETMAKVQRISEYFLDLMSLHPEDWSRYADGDVPVITDERDDDRQHHPEVER